MVARRAAPGRRRRCRTPGAKRGRARRRAAAPLEHFKPGLGDVAIVLAFTGLRWEEAVAVPVDNVDLDGQCMTIDRTASESGGRRDVRNDMKTRAAVRVVMIPDIAMPAVRRLLERGEAGREQSGGTRYSRLINGERGGYIGYAMWRRYLALAHGYTASHQDGMVKYTAHELRHVCASLLIASGASDVQVANQMGHRKIETTKNIYGHLFAQDRKLILKAINQGREPPLRRRGHRGRRGCLTDAGREETPQGLGP
jgi:integrase